jgi:hypothetical protein
LAHWVLIPRRRGRGAWFGSFFHIDTLSK